MEFMKQLLIAFVTGGITGAVFAFVKIEAPAPNIIGLAGIAGIVFSYALVKKFVMS